MLNCTPGTTSALSPNFTLGLIRPRSQGQSARTLDNRLNPDLKCEMVARATDQNGHQFAKKSRRTPARGTCYSLMFFFCSSSAPGSPPRRIRVSGVRQPVSRVLCQPRERRAMAIPLGRPLPDASRDLPGRLARKPAFPPQRERRPYLVLLPVGFTVPSPSPATRCALTAPFHPHPQA
jgi:hypothetical protein